MSVSGVNSIGPDDTTLVRLTSLAGAARAQAATSVAAATAAQPASSAQEIAAQNALIDYIEGEAPDDASIGLYSSDMAAAGAQAGEVEAAFASELQSTAIQQEQTLLQALETKELGNVEVAQQIQFESQIQSADAAQFGAVADIDRQLTEALTAARLNAVATDMQGLLQASEAGDADNAAGIAASLQNHLASLDETTLTQAFSPASTQFGQPALPTQAQMLIALSQSGDMAAAATLARTIQAQMQASLPSVSALNALLATLPPTSLSTLSILDLDMNPLLLAVQLNMLIRAKETIEKLRRREVDHVKILPVPQVGEGEFHEDKARADD